MDPFKFPLHDFYKGFHHTISVTVDLTISWNKMSVGGIIGNHDPWPHTPGIHWGNIIVLLRVAFYDEEVWLILQCYMRFRVNSLRLSDAYMHQRNKPLLVQIMACCLVWCQAIIWTNADLFFQLDPKEQTSVKILIEMWTISFKEMHFKMLSTKWWPSCLSPNELIHWGLNKMATILQTADCNAFSLIRSFLVGFKLHWSLFLGSISQWVIIGSGNGLAPNRRQTITWTNYSQFKVMHSGIVRP